MVITGCSPSRMAHPQVESLDERTIQTLATALACSSCQFYFFLHRFPCCHCWREPAFCCCSITSPATSSGNGSWSTLRRCPMCWPTTPRCLSKTNAPSWGRYVEHTAYAFSLTTLYTRLAVCCVGSLKNRTFRSLNTCFGLCKIFCIFLSRKFNSPTTTKYLASLPQALSTLRRSRLPVERHEVNSSVL